ncbi:MAG: D-amino acid aminotransferase [Micavibrio sp.]|nr:D-amino acid aminotransferase [Micavibrio sp.]|tara:strand:- start:2553 stop:3428 length:876 start_codon:yes stop_codon:yes gene_type:complete
MPRISYVNGAYVPHQRACVHIEDRGFVFADGVYEVIGLINGKYADECGHLDRLERSMRELQINPPKTRDAIRFIMRELVRRNRLQNAAIYLQVTRGTAKRDFKFPTADTPSTLVMMCWPFNYDANPNVQNGVKVCSVPDQRWARRDIKTVALLPQVLAKQKAAEQGCYEALMLDGDGMINEGGASNFWIYKDGVLKTHQADQSILKGVTRTAVCDIAAKHNIKIVEGPFGLDEAINADEAFCTSATALIVPVVQIDDHVLGDGKPGPLARKIYHYYRDYADHEKQQLYWVY